MRRRLIIAAAVVAGGTALFGIPQAAQAAPAAAAPAASAPLCLVGVHVAIGSLDLIPQTNICL